MKAFFKEKGLYLLCLALVLVATVTGVLAVSKVVHSVTELAGARQKALEEESAWNQPDTIVTNPAEDVPLATPAPTSAPSASPSPSSQPSSAPPQPSAGSGAAGGSSGSAASPGGSSTWPADAEPLRAFSGSELVYSETLGDWRTHNGADYACEQGSGVQAVQGGTVEAVEQDALWGGVVTVAADENGVRWRYCGLQNIAVAAGDTVARGDILGTLGPIPSESRDPSHLHLECLQGEQPINPEAMKP